ISSKLYFGPGIFSETNEEFWHGNIWAESPLFGQSKIHTLKGEFTCGDFVYYSTLNGIKYGRIRSFIMVKNILKVQIQRLLTFDKIPSYFKSREQSRNANKKLWLLEESTLLIIDISNLINQCTIWLEDTNILPLQYEFSIAE